MPVVMANAFNGSGKFKDWLAAFELCTEFNNWNTETPRKFLVVRLRGDGHEVYVNLEEDTKTDYK